MTPPNFFVDIVNNEVFPGCNLIFPVNLSSFSLYTMCLTLALNVRNIFRL